METLKIYYGVNELGEGHAFRATVISERLLDRGHELSFFTSHPKIKENFGDICEVYKCTPVRWYESSKGIDSLMSILNIFLPLPSYDYENRSYKNGSNSMHIKRSAMHEEIRRYYDIRKFAKEVLPDKIITDADPNLIRWALRRGMTPEDIYLITNETRPYYNLKELLTLYPLQRLTEKYIRESTIIVPDLEPPYTMCELNLIGTAGDYDSIYFVGPYAELDTMEPADKGFIYFSINGPYGTRALLENRFLPILEKFAEETKCEVVVSLGDPRRKEEHKGTISKYGWLTNEERKRCMREAHIIMHSGSHGNCMETILNGKVCIAIPTQAEQRGQAKKIEMLHCGEMAENPNELVKKVEAIEDDYDSYASVTKKLRAKAKEMNGVERTLEIIEKDN